LDIFLMDADDRSGGSLDQQSRESQFLAMESSSVDNMFDDRVLLEKLVGGGRGGA
jgi:hypothetical protein